jgi:hypothetical protein
MHIKHDFDWGNNEIILVLRSNTVLRVISILLESGSQHVDCRHEAKVLQGRVYLAR